MSELLRPGTLLDGKYEVVHLMGEGALGAVYEGRNVAIGRRVAIKVMRARLARAKDRVARFEREAQAAARIGSTRVADVLDLGDLQHGERYMVLEFLEGESLAARLVRRGRLSLAEMTTIAVQLLEGLAKVHDAGIVHRDLKPANVFLQSTEVPGEDFVKILDFGVCKVRGESGEVTTGIGEVLGTPSYMAPEHFEIGPAALDGRADLYSVGVILYKAVAERLPYVATSVLQLIAELREGRHLPLDEALPGIDPRFSAIVERAIEWDPRARYQDARQFAAAIAQWSGSVAPAARETLPVPGHPLALPETRPDPFTPEQVRALLAAAEEKSRPR